MTHEDELLLLPYEKPPGPSRAELAEMLASFAGRGGKVTKLVMGDSIFFPKKKWKRKASPDIRMVHGYATRSRALRR